MKKKHNYKTRLKIAIDALSKNEIMTLINSNSKFKSLENDYISIQIGRASCRERV